MDGRHGCRYEREFKQAKRPVLKRLLEQDWPAHKLMVLQVCSCTIPGQALRAHACSSLKIGQAHAVKCCAVWTSPGSFPGMWGCFRLMFPEHISICWPWLGQ